MNGECYDPNRYPGVPIPADWVCAFVACGQRADQPHVDGCPYAPTPEPPAGEREIEALAGGDSFGEWLHRMHGVVSSCDHTTEARGLIDALQPWLASHDAATADRVRREVEEPLIVLDGLLCKWESNPAYRRGTAAAEVRTALGEHLDRIAREAGR